MKKHSIEIIKDEYKYFSNKDMDNIEDNYMVPIFDDIIKRYPVKNVLDYGCGNGIFGIYLKRKTGCVLIGVDGSAYGLSKSKEIGYDKTFLVKDFNIDKLPLNEGTFDLILCKDILEHLIEPLEVIKEAKRVLTDSGVLLIHVPHHFSLKNRIKYLFTHNIDTQEYFPDSSEHNFPHIRFFTMLGLRKMLTESGFDVINDYSKHFPSCLPIPFTHKITKLFARIFPDNFADGFTLLCKKRSLNQANKEII